MGEGEGEGEGAEEEGEGAEEEAGIESRWTIVDEGGWGLGELMEKEVSGRRER